MVWRKKTNNFSVNLYYSRYTGLNTNYYSQTSYYDMYNPYYYGYGYGYGGYGYGGYDYQDMAEYAHDPDQLFTIIGASIGHGKRLNGPTTISIYKEN